MGTGGALTRVPGGDATLRGVARGAGRHLLPPPEVRVLIDRDYLFSALGTLAPGISGRGAGDLPQLGRIRDARTELSLMYLRTPRLEIYTDRIETNARAVIGLCREHGVRVACVTKVIGAHPAILHALEDAGADMIADSRVRNLESIADAGLTLPVLLLRSPTPSRVVDVVRSAEYSLNSSAETIELLSRAAGLLRRTHKVIIMVDLGDLREGVWPDRVVSVVREAADCANVEIVGLGTNLACYGGVIPTPENMKMLVDLRDACREATDLPSIRSGGNSANLPLLAGGGRPRKSTTSASVRR